MQTITKKRMIYKSKVEYMSGPGIYTMNHVLGCSHGCKYPCYAYLTAKRFGQVDSYEDWCNPKLIENTMSLLEAELKAKRQEPIERVHLCFTTDPFMYKHPEVQNVTLKAVALINSFGIPVSILTKGLYPQVEQKLVREVVTSEDAPLCGGVCLDTRPQAHKGVDLPSQLLETSARPSVALAQTEQKNEYGISLVSLNENFRKVWEPNSAPYTERIASLKTLHDAGCKTWVSMEPFPALTYAGHIERYGYEQGDCPESAVPKGYNDFACWLRRQTDLNELVMLKDCLSTVSFVDKIVFGRWNYNDNMPCDVPNPEHWYQKAVQLVRDFCSKNKIECIIKKGSE